MDVNQSDIIELANMIFSQQSFDYETFEKAKATQKTVRLNCEFDRMTLHIYSHNLTADEYELLQNLLRAKLCELNRDQNMTLYLHICNIKQITLDLQFKSAFNPISA